MLPMFKSGISVPRIQATSCVKLPEAASLPQSPPNVEVIKWEKEPTSQFCISVEDKNIF